MALLLKVCKHVSLTKRKFRLLGFSYFVRFYFICAYHVYYVSYDIFVVFNYNAIDITNVLSTINILYTIV